MSVNEVLSKSEVAIIALVDALLLESYSLRASDIHIDPTRGDTRVRFRIDGVLSEAYFFPKIIHAEIVARIKVLASLRTDEHAASQDGRFRFLTKDIEYIDMRVSIMPTYYGENIVIRILSDNASHATLLSLGFSSEDQKKIFTAVQKQNGMILATGPTGSGKTTTLYALIKLLNQEDISILTLEDPIEYAIEQVTQIQINPRAGLTFANGLRSILRQDPNILMVGEIRDSETATIAVNTALTGHLLLSTLHTNDAATTLPRLLDMGIESYLIASTVRIAIAQRLIRTLCEICKVECAVSEDMIQSLASLMIQNNFVLQETIYAPRGCEVCKGSGYIGRISINEVLEVDEEIASAILQKASAYDIRLLAIKRGMTTMLEDGFKKVRLGLTTIEEVLRAAHQ